MEDQFKVLTVADKIFEQVNNGKHPLAFFPKVHIKKRDYLAQYTLYDFEDKGFSRIFLYQAKTIAYEELIDSNLTENPIKNHKPKWSYLEKFKKRK